MHNNHHFVFPSPAQTCSWNGEVGFWLGILIKSNFLFHFQMILDGTKTSKLLYLLNVLIHVILPHTHTNTHTPNIWTTKNCRKQIKNKWTQFWRIRFSWLKNQTNRMHVDEWDGHCRWRRKTVCFIVAHALTYPNGLLSSIWKPIEWMHIKF